MSQEGLMALQRTAGNAAVLRMLQLAGHPCAQPPDQERHGRDACCGHQGAQADEAPVQRSAVHDVLASTGRPLGAPLREEMEARLGADFTDVRIHNDHSARASATEVGARAYASGHHVVIGDDGTDKHTLAHELTHVIQQRQGLVTGTDNGNGLSISNPSDHYEREAEANAQRAMAGPAPVLASPGSEGPAMTMFGSGTIRATAVQRTADEGMSEKAKGKRKWVPPHNELVAGWEASSEYAHRFTSSSGADQLGALSTEERVRSERRSFAQERSEQTMRHIAIRLLSCIHHLRTIAPTDKKPRAEAEFQGMVINDRLVLSSNINDSIELMEGLGSQGATSFKEMLGMETPLVGANASGYQESLLINERRRAARAGLGRVFKAAPSGYEADDERTSTGKAPQSARNVTGDVLVRATRAPTVEGEAAPRAMFEVAEVDLTSTEVNEGLRHLLTSDEYRNVIILVKTANEIAAREGAVIHAEQKLVAALKAARITLGDITADSFLIRGSKRPCLACGALLRHVSDNMFEGRLALNRNPGAYYKNSLRAIEAYSLGQPWDPDAMEVDHEPTENPNDAWHAQILEKLKSSTGHVSVFEEQETRTFETGSSGHDSDDLDGLPMHHAGGLDIPDTWKKPTDTVKKQKTQGQGSQEKKGARYAAGKTSPDFTEEHKTEIKSIIGDKIWEDLQNNVKGTAAKITAEQWRRVFARSTELGYSGESLRRALNLANSTFSRMRSKHKK
ncbi:eCIS core domain-containing protein [Streptomyces sp. NPDC056305]|uniref:eCIS core domain-containing protein n=2 Tax=Streptomyces TaxID=1883 RepID=UPI0035D9AE4D